MIDVTVLARRVLPDALEELRPHLDAVVLVGAQAIYVRVGDDDLSVAPYTTDVDLALDPSLLSERPPLGDTLRGFTRAGGDHVGAWFTERDGVRVDLDLLVPASVNPGERAPRRAAPRAWRHRRS